MLQTSVEMVKPGGTGRPALVISARPEPLPPSRSFMLRFPSALPLPKKYTCFPLDFFFALFFAIVMTPSRYVVQGFRPACALLARSPRCPQCSESSAAAPPATPAAPRERRDRPP